MLGVRLKPEEEKALTRHARALGKPKSTLVREWIMDRLEREEIDRKIANAASLDAKERRRIVDRTAEEATVAYMRWLDAEDGGYNWGPDGPPRPTLKRGDIFLVREPRTPAGKARPCVIVQRDSALPFAAKVTVRPLTSQLRGAAGQRPFVAATRTNGLSSPSEVQVDWVYTFPREFIGDRIGSVDDPTLEQIDIALRRWLDL